MTHELPQQLRSFSAYEQWFNPVVFAVYIGEGGKSLLTDELLLTTRAVDRDGRTPDFIFLNKKLSVFTEDEDVEGHADSAGEALDYASEAITAAIQIRSHLILGSKHHEHHIWGGVYEWFVWFTKWVERWAYTSSFVVDPGYVWDEKGMEQIRSASIMLAEMAGGSPQWIEERLTRIYSTLPLQTVEMARYAQLVLGGVHDTIHPTDIVEPLRRGGQNDESIVVSPMDDIDDLGWIGLLH